MGIPSGPNPTGVFLMTKTMDNARKIEAALKGIVPVDNVSRSIDAAPVTYRHPGEPGRLPRRGRLIFCLDLTASRQAALRQARIATATMFDAIKAAGKIVLKLAYFRGDSECRASGWHDDPHIVSLWMQRLACESGETQIARLLRMVLGEVEDVSGVVFVGDHCEDDRSELRNLAKELGKKSIPVFVFHECADCDRRSLKAKPTFKSIADYSGGVYVEFRPDSGAVLRELLTNVAAFSAGGSEGVMKMAPPATAEARELRSRLLLGSGG